MPIGQIVSHEDGNGIEFVLQFRCDILDLGLGDLQSWPAIPLECCGLGQTAETSHQPTR